MRTSRETVTDDGTRLHSLSHKSYTHKHNNQMLAHVGQRTIVVVNELHPRLLPHLHPRIYRLQVRTQAARNKQYVSFLDMTHHMAVPRHLPILERRNPTHTHTPHQILIRIKTTGPAPRAVADAARGGPLPLPPLRADAARGK